MAKILKVAVVGTTGLPRFFEESTALEAYDLTSDQVCRLLENSNPTDISSNNGFVQTVLGVSPLMKYEVTCGGRSGFYVSREEVAAVMQDVQILIVTSWVETLVMYRGVLEWIQYLSQENFFDNCKMIIIRVFRNRHDKKISVPSIDSVLNQYGIDIAKYGGKMHLVIDPKNIHSKRSRKKKLATAELAEGIERIRSTLCSKEAVEDIVQMTVQPVKETISASKALLEEGQKLASWVVGLFKR